MSAILKKKKCCCVGGGDGGGGDPCPLCADLGCIRIRFTGITKGDNEAAYTIGSIAFPTVTRQGTINNVDFFLPYRGTAAFSKLVGYDPDVICLYDKTICIDANPNDRYVGYVRFGQTAHGPYTIYGCTIFLRVEVYRIGVHHGDTPHTPKIRVSAWYGYLPDDGCTPKISCCDLPADPLNTPYLDIDAGLMDGVAYAAVSTDVGPVPGTVAGAIFVGEADFSCPDTGIAINSSLSIADLNPINTFFYDSIIRISGSWGYGGQVDVAFVRPDTAGHCVEETRTCPSDDDCCRISPRAGGATYEFSHRSVVDMTEVISTVDWPEEAECCYPDFISLFEGVPFATCSANSVTWTSSDGHFSATWDADFGWSYTFPTKPPCPSGSGFITCFEVPAGDSDTVTTTYGRNDQGGLFKTTDFYFSGIPAHELVRVIIGVRNSGC